MSLVDLPTKHIAKQKVNGTTYIYYRSNYRRLPNGKSSFDEISIGKLDLGSGKLIPNRNYHDLFSKSKQSSAHILDIKRPGIVHVFDAIAKKIGLYDTLTSVFDQEAS